MIVRPALFSDIPDIVDLCEEARSASKYAGIAAVRKDALKATLFSMIAKHGGSEPGDTHVIVAIGAKGMDGILAGVCTWLYEITDIRMVTDIFWFTRRGANALAAKKMAAALHDWASAMPGPVILRHGVTNSISPPERTQKMLARMGMKQVGMIYEKELSR